MTTGLDQAIARVGGERNATIIVGAAGAGVVWYIGRRKHAKAQAAATTPTVMAQGYADTAQDPTALYTGYDQLQQEIDNLRNQPAGAPNPNPVPVPTSPGSPPPVAPIPPPPPPAPAATPLTWEQQQAAGQPAVPRPVIPAWAMGGPSGPPAGYAQGPGGGGAGGHGPHNPWF